MIQHEYAIALTFCVFPASFSIIILAISKRFSLQLWGDLYSPWRRMLSAYPVGSLGAAFDQASKHHSLIAAATHS